MGAKRKAGSRYGDADRAWVGFVAVHEVHAYLTGEEPLDRRDLAETDFVWFPHRQHPMNYDLLLRACTRGGLTNSRIAQEAVDQATMLSLVSCELGVAFVIDATRWRCPKEVMLQKIDDLRLPLTVSWIWRKDDASPFLAHVRQLAGTWRPTPTSNGDARHAPTGLRGRFSSEPSPAPCLMTW